MREGELLAHIYERSAGMGSGVVVGPGDDCALVKVGGARVLLATDQLVAGRHFDQDTTPVELVARKALARNVSDVAAMAGTPTHTLCAASLPTGYPHADRLFDDCHRWATRFGCPLVGGDIATTTGPLALTVTIVGTPHPRRGAVLRSGARPGDGVFVTGPLGASYASGWHLRFEPRIEVAQRLADDLGDGLHAMIDLSDGLGLDGGRVAQASGVRLEIEGGAVPLREGAEGWRSACEGEDYELLVCADAEAIDGLVRIGRVVEGAGCVVTDRDGTHDAHALGWEHGS
ncbi:MAG: thiamine-phosphate kinase [Planctomycetota bacterium]